MMPNTMVENNPPMNPSHVFLGDSCGGHSQGEDTRLIYQHVSHSTFNMSTTLVNTQSSYTRIVFATQCGRALELQPTPETEIISKYLVVIYSKQTRHLVPSLMIRKLRIRDGTNLDERGAAEEETKHVGHNVITDHTGDWHNEPIQTKNEFTSNSYMRPTNEQNWIST